MCSHYVGEKARAKLARMGVHLPADWIAPSGSMHIYPTQFAPILRRPPELDSGDEAVPDIELVPARFGLLPGFAKDIKYGVRTYNARSETVASLASFKGAWAKPRHCIVPCEAIYEPDWRTGKHVPSRISRADGETLRVAGLWHPWKSPAGEWVNSFTMLTINADAHEIFKELHRPDPKRDADKQDKRMVVILHEEEYSAWLDAPPEKSFDFLRHYPANRLTVKPEPKEPLEPGLPLIA
jgi:putative SOS response-associated peptidase YedK